MSARPEPQPLHLETLPYMKRFLLTLGIIVVGFNGWATITWNSGTLNSVIPDANPNGWANSHVISGEAGVIQSVNVTLDLMGGWNGDLYAYLVSSSGGFCTLLDRVGPGLYGYDDNGFAVTLSDTGGYNINSYQGYGYSGNLNGNNQITGTWQAEGGSLNSAFGTLSPNGTWTLFIADLSGGGVTTVQNWGLQMDIVAVPEVETWIAAALASAFGAFWISRQLRRGVR
jgi:subtilisin-like proprotein convertase family protein